jgi:predicted metal-dependent enzyme (double-stranded beta helix superfamily)
MEGKMRFDLDQFLTDCESAHAADASHKGVREVVARAVRESSAVLAALGEPRQAGINVLHNTPSLTVLNLVWGPGMTIMPHDHRMWAVIGIYTGREDNIFWRKLPDAPDREIEAAGARSLCVGDCCALGRDIVHSVTNPIPRLTGAIHVYGGDFLRQERSAWDAESLQEGPYDTAKVRRMFEESNRLLPMAA